MIIKKVTKAMFGLMIALASLTTNAQDEMKGKLMMGYQGWFLAQGDGSGPNDWRHWFSSRTNPSPEFFTIDMWPDMSEYTDAYDTNMTYSNGSNAQLFSSHDLSTTRKHFEWMRDYNIFGVHLQRFLSETADPRFFEFRNNVLQNVITASNEYGRHFSVMYDLSGVADDGNLYNKLITDWEYLVDNYDVLNQPNYVKEDGRPVVAIWGIGFKNRGLKPETFKAIIDYFHTNADPKYRAYVMGGVPDGWRTLSGSSESDAAWTDIYNSLDMISPWSVGRYSNNSGADNWNATRIVPDLQACEDIGVDYMPVIWPGFSWLNLKGGSEPINKIPRNKGEFYWRQAYNAIKSGSKYIYVAMFDEVDEATAMFKITETKAELPVQAQDILVPLDIDGTKLPSDWYLQLADQTQRMLEGSIPLSSTMPIQPVSSLGNGSEFIAQNNIPDTMNPGETITIEVTFKNTGITTWTKSGQYKLGSQAPEDNTIWGTNRIELNSDDNILPGEQKTFQFTVTAPNQAGIFNMQWRMLKESAEWFGAFSITKSIVVGDVGTFLDTCDYNTDWGPSSISINTRDQKQGLGCLERSSNNTDEFRKIFTQPFNSNSNEANAVLKFWYYVSDVSLLRSDNQVEIGSSGTADVNEYSWSLSGLTNGWNYVELNTSDAGKIGNPDLSAINWFRLYRFKNGAVTTRIDAIELLDKTLSVTNNVVNTDFKLYPNPTSSDLFIDVSNDTNSSIAIEIINLLGQTIFKKDRITSTESGYQKIKLPISHLNKGTYFARVRVNNTISTKRFVKN